MGIDDYFMSIAILASTRSTCIRRAVGCVAINKLNHIIATGYNGSPRGTPHCIDVPCEGALFKSGEGLNKCQSAHAEINCLLQCPDVNDIKKIYVTTSPCSECIKALCNTEVEEIVYFLVYSHEYPVYIKMRQHNNEFLRNLHKGVGR